MIKEYKHGIKIDLDTGIIDDSAVLVCHGGGKGYTPPEQKIVEPVAPVREAGVLLDEEASEDEKKKKALKTGKSSLKLPSTTKDAGLSTQAGSGLKI